MPIAAETSGLDKRRVGDVPEGNAWVRLEVPASAVWDAAGGNLDGFAINAVEFTQRGGDVEWASFGKEDSGGLVYSYIADDAPAGATLTTEGDAGTNGWPWTTVAGREDFSVAEFGTVVTNDVPSIISGLNGPRISSQTTLPLSTRTASILSWRRSMHG
jgi:hypothetical protein